MNFAGKYGEMVRNVGEELKKRARPPLGPMPWLALSALLAISCFQLGQSLRLPEAGELSDSVQRLTSEVNTLRRAHTMAATVLNLHRDSICFLQGSYSFHHDSESWQWPESTRTRFSGTGFIVAPGVIATNRHVAEPWFDDPEAEELLQRGARPRLDSFMAYCPRLAEAIPLKTAAVSTHADVAVAKFNADRLSRALRPLPLSNEPGAPGEPVVVVGYPLGVTAMVAKSPRPVYRRLSEREDEQDVVRELAALSLIRPSVTHGHVGDLVGDKLIYDAATAIGGSGGPVFNTQGRVIGVNAAYLDGFSGSSLGISIDALRPLIEATHTK